MPFRIAEVEGSIPFESTKKKDTTQVVSFFLGSAAQWAAPPFGDPNAGRKHPQGVRHIHRAAKLPTAAQ